MITIRIEFYYEEDRLNIIDNLSKSFEIIELGVIKPSKRKNSKALIQYIELAKKQ